MLRVCVRCHPVIVDTGPVCPFPSHCPAHTCRRTEIEREGARTANLVPEYVTGRWENLIRAARWALPSWLLARERTGSQPRSSLRTLHDAPLTRWKRETRGTLPQSSTGAIRGIVGLSGPSPNGGGSLTLLPSRSSRSPSAGVTIVGSDCSLS